MRIKRIAFSILSCIALFASSIPMAAFAESTGNVASVTDGSGNISNYTSLSDAISNADDGSTVTLLKSIDLNQRLTVSKPINIDLGTNTLTLTDFTNVKDTIGILTQDAGVTIKNGTISDNRSYDNNYMGYTTIYVYNSSTLKTENLTVKAYKPNGKSNYNYLIMAMANTTTGGVTLGSGTSLTEMENTDSANTEDVIKSYGVVGIGAYGLYSTADYKNLENKDSAKAEYVTVKDGASINTTGYCISSNGSWHPVDITIEGGNLTSTESTGIYFPGAGTLDISGGTITGYNAGVEIRAGELNMTGGSVKATSSPTNSQGSGSGTTAAGAAIAVSQHTTNLPITVNISGSSVVEGYTALYQATLETNNDPDIIDVNITGGSFTSTNSNDDAAAIYAEDTNTVQVSGGTFSSDISVYVPEDMSSVENGDGSFTVVPDYAAVIGENKYDTIQSAIDAVANGTETAGSTITLVRDVTENINIPEGCNVTLDLKGYTLSNNSNTHTIINYGTLKIEDTGGTGVVDNINHQKAALYNYPTGTVTLNGGKFTRSQEAGVDKNTHGGNSYYVLMNWGEMEINSPTSVYADGAYSSLIENGYYDASKQNTANNNPTLIINGGTFEGGLNIVKNDDASILKIKDGKFTLTDENSQHAVMNYGAAAIEYGNFSTIGATIYNYSYGNEVDPGILTLTGGEFTSKNSAAVYVHKATDYTDSEGNVGVTITGGKFTTVNGSSTVYAYSGSGNVSVEGGYYSDANADDYVAEGSVMMKDEESRYYYIHTHNTVKTEAAAATCTTAGNIEYWYCSGCSKYFSDEKGNSKIADSNSDGVIDINDTVIPATGHNMTHHARVEATCTTAGNIEYWYCETEHKYFSDANGNTEINEAQTVIPVKGHNMKHHARVEATCTKAGNIEYWYCETEHKYFSDANGSTEINEAQTVINAKGHNMTHHDRVEATCTENGNIEYWYCETEQKYFSDANGNNEITEAQTVIHAAGHNMTHHERVEATCTSDGNIEYWYCETEQKYFNDENGEKEITLEDTVISAAGHNMTHHDRVEATCTNDGNIEYWYCETEQKCFSDENGSTEIALNDTVISATGHSFTNYVSNNDATCTEDGTKTAECDNGCGEKDTIADTGSAAGHKYENGVCTVCGEKDPNYVAPTNPTVRPGVTKPTTVQKPKIKAPKQAKLTKLHVKGKIKKAINVTWKKVKGAKGYEVEVSTSKKFKKSKKVLTKKTKKLKLVIKNKKIKSGKTYYVRVRAYTTYKDQNGNTKKVNSKWNYVLRKVKIK